MWVLWVIVVGLIAGAIARLVLPGRDPIGFLGTIAVGIAGALLGWWVGSLLVGRAVVVRHPWLSAIIGAIVVLALTRAVAGRRRLGGMGRWRLARRWSW